MNSSCSLICLLHSTVPPKLIFFPSAVRNVVRGESLVASCRATANPLPEIQWFNGTQLLSSGDHTSVNVSQSSDGITTSSQLTVTEFTSEDAGLYFCLAVNDLGNDSRSFQVNAVGELHTSHCVVRTW